MERFDTIYHKYKTRIYLLAWQYVPHHIGEELANDVWVTYYHEMDKIAPDAVYTWLKLAVKNKCLNWLKRQSRPKYNAIHIPITEGFDLADTDERYVDFYAQIIDMVIKILEGMTKAEKRAFWKFYFENKTTGEIAEELGLSNKTIKEQRYRAAQKLREKLKPFLNRLGY